MIFRKIKGERLKEEDREKPIPACDAGLTDEGLPACDARLTDEGLAGKADTTAI